MDIERWNILLQTTNVFWNVYKLLASCSSLYTVIQNDVNGYKILLKINLLTLSSFQRYWSTITKKFPAVYVSHFLFSYISFQFSSLVSIYILIWSIYLVLSFPLGLGLDGRKIIEWIIKNWIDSVQDRNYWKPLSLRYWNARFHKPWGELVSHLVN